VIGQTSERRQQTILSAATRTDDQDLLAAGQDGVGGWIRHA